MSSVFLLNSHSSGQCLCLWESHTLPPSQCLMTAKSSANYIKRSDGRLPARIFLTSLGPLASMSDWEPVIARNAIKARIHSHLNRRHSLAELCNPKLVRLAQVPHRTADREDPKLARRKWQPPHNMGEPQTENTLDNTFKHRNCTNGQILRSGSKLIEAGDYTSI